MFDQNVNGFFNKPNYNIFQAKASVDILPQDLDVLLGYLSGSNGENGAIFLMNNFNLAEKNDKNGVDKEYFENVIKNDVEYFSDIENALKNDKDDLLKSKYALAKKILNSTYFASFKGKMPEFIQQVAAKHKHDTKCEDEMTVKLMQLLHYMYTSCDIGLKP